MGFVKGDMTDKLACWNLHKTSDKKYISHHCFLYCVLVKFHVFRWLKCGKITMVCTFFFHVTILCRYLHQAIVKLSVMYIWTKTNIGRTLCLCLYWCGNPGLTLSQNKTHQFSVGDLFQLIFCSIEFSESILFCCQLCTFPRWQSSVWSNFWFSTWRSATYSALV